MTLIVIYKRFMNFKQTEGLAKPTIHCYYERFHYLNDYLGWDVPNDEITAKLFRIVLAICLMN